MSKMETELKMSLWTMDNEQDMGDASEQMEAIVADIMPKLIDFMLARKILRIAINGGPTALPLDYTVDISVTPRDEPVNIIGENVSNVLQ